MFIIKYYIVCGIGVDKIFEPIMLLIVLIMVIDIL